MFSKLKQIKDLRERAKSLQSSLAEERVEGAAGWGKVKVTMDGNQKVLGVSIDPSVMNDQKKLEEMVKDAMNDAVEKLRRLLATKMKDLGGLDLAQNVQDMMKK